LTLKIDDSGTGGVEDRRQPVISGFNELRFLKIPK
jgi:hypothetical protein